MSEIENSEIKPKKLKNFRKKFLNVHAEVAVLTVIILITLIGAKNVIFPPFNGFIGDPKAFFHIDSEIWYAIYHYFAESISNGVTPLWNPYMGGGMPFFPFIGLQRALDPLVIIPILISIVFDLSIYYLYHLVYVLNLVIISIGVYLVLRYVNRNPEAIEQETCLFNTRFVINILLFTLFLNFAFSSGFAAPSLPFTFCWTPYILLFFLRFIDKKKLSDFLWTIYFLGILIGASSYHFAFPVFFFLCFVLSTLVFSYETFVNNLSDFMKKYKVYVATSLICLAIMSLPILATSIESFDSIYPAARTWSHRDVFEKEDKFSLSYEDMMQEGSIFTLDDIERILKDYPKLVTNVSLMKEAYPDWYMPLLDWAQILIFFSVVGVIFGKNKWKRHFLTMTVLTVFGLMGYNTPVHKIMTIIFFPLKYTRHTVMFLGFFLFCYSYFVALGLNFLVERQSAHKGKITLAIIILTSVYLSYGAINVNLKGILQTKLAPDFNHKAQKFEFIRKRKLALPRSGWYLLDPILYKEVIALGMLANPPKDMPKAESPYYLAWHKICMENKIPNRYDCCFGLREHAWSRNYHKIYLLGERKIDVFNSLMGVDEDIIDFKENIIKMNDDSVKELVNSVSGKEFKDLLQKTVIINASSKSKDPKNFKIFAKGDARKLINDKNKTNLNFSYNVSFYNVNKLEMDINVNKSGMLLFKDGYNKNWKAYVNGEKVNIERANVGFKGIYLKQGKHKVEFVYRPLFYIFAFYSFIFLSLTGPFFIFWSNRLISNRSSYAGEI